MDSDYPFHTNLWPRAIFHPDDRDPAATRICVSLDFNQRSEAEKKKAIAAWVKTLPELRNLTGLRLWSHVTQPLFDAICELGNLEALQIKWSNIRKLDAVVRLGALKTLSIGSSTRVESIEPLTSLHALEFLELENFKLISDFSPLASLRGLKSLSVTGSMWARQSVASLEPFSRMTWLDSLCVDTSKVISLRPLASLVGLKHLGLGGRLPFEEYAWLAARLPNTECRRFQPYLDLSDSGYSPCKVCGRKSMVLLTGKGKPVLCRHCDEAKLARHVAQFEQVRAATAAG